MVTRTVGAVGGGTMGSGIAQVMPASGFDVEKVEARELGRKTGRGFFDYSAAR